MNELSWGTHAPIVVTDPEEESQFNLSTYPAESTFENKVADFYTSLSTDKRFILLDNGKWDLRSNHTSDKIIKVRASVSAMSHIVMSQ